MMPRTGKDARADVAIVGAGPAGMMAAIAAAEAGARVILLEQLDRPGAKLLATGGGRCNLTNTLPADQFMTRFGRQGRFMEPALAAMGSQALRDFFHSLGVPTHAPDGLHVYPVSDSAGDVLGGLRKRIKALGVEVHTRVRATGLCLAAPKTEDDPLFSLEGLKVEGGRLAVPRVIVATGGQGYPELGATGDGYDLAREAGHSVIEPTPAAVPLLVKETWPGRLAGVSVSSVQVWIDLAKCPKSGARGDVLFTHTGLSGPAVLDLSGDVAEILTRQATVPIRINLTPGTTGEGWLRRLNEWAERDGRRRVRALLDPHLPRSLATAVLFLAAVTPETHVAQIPSHDRHRIADLLVGLPLTVTGTEGFAKAMVTRGGVSLKEVDPPTLESRLLAGLHFAGEVLDLDGPSGGFNLQWAFSSGRLAGRAAVGQSG